MKGSLQANCNLECVPCTHPGQWLYLFEEGGVVYSEVGNRFAGLDAAGVSAYRAFDAGAQVQDLRFPGNDRGLTSAPSDALEAIHALSQGDFPGEDVPAAWPALDPSSCEDPPTATIEIDGIPVSLHYPTGHLGSLCRDYFRNCRMTLQSPRCSLSAQQEKNTWVIRVNGREFLTLEREHQIGLGLMHAARALLYAEGDYDIAFHAAMVAHGNRGIMLCAPRECGKSTLAAYLVAQGFELLADEPALLHIDTWSVQALRLPLSLKQGSWSSLREHWPQLAEAPVHVRSDGTKICLAHPTDEHRSTAPRHVTQLVFPHYSASSVPHAESLLPLHTLRLLSEGGMLLARHFTRDGFEAFLKWVCLTPAYKLEYASLQEACALLRQIDQSFARPRI